MPKAAVLPLSLDPSSGTPAYRQLYEQIRALILEGRVCRGARLPSTRALAADLALSRSTVVAAYEQLASEGYLQGRHGSGIYVSDIPEESLHASPRDRRDGRRKPRPQHPPPGREPWPTPALPLPFGSLGPDMRLFPLADWAKLVARSWRQADGSVLGGQPPTGHPALRRAIADHLTEWRGVSASPDRIIVTAGAGDGIELTLRALTRRGDPVAIEDPSYVPLRTMLAAHGLRRLAIPSDSRGLALDVLEAAAPPPRVAVVTPSRQFPLGHTLPLARRLRLLDWAEATDAVIIEDDYDSEYRYAGRPIEALAALDADERVIYVGTFSKVFSPGLRLGYLVVPGSLLGRFEATLAAFGPRASFHTQPALAAFMAEGLFAQHIRRTRRIYAARQDALLGAVREALGSLLAVEPQTTGMHVIARPSARLTGDDGELSRLAAAAGVTAPALSRYFVGPPRDAGLLLGFAAFEPEEVRRAVDALAAAFAPR
ncbi:PLP-dependent aminotransferase family protein [Chelatococcus sp. SYSU_G07232]|uniref:PLP-dependent aminotransferase family protein n=1 Tax=Chelatococcus albus TaxID=3047466 RepID=A0ABT7AKK3_9HYPH|nr:PLP-dependent aminotransferase family protein [Chelatococcus sp. SYSU_G07232]MDJ1159369.1 PLP-dependent aminotransferase family protein [Chelatococcus sp. SYSU_G07232]